MTCPAVQPFFCVFFSPQPFNPLSRDGGVRSEPRSFRRTRRPFVCAVRGAEQVHRARQWAAAGDGRRWTSRATAPPFVGSAGAEVGRPGVDFFKVSKESRASALAHSGLRRPSSSGRPRSRGPLKKRRRFGSSSRATQGHTGREERWICCALGPSEPGRDRCPQRACGQMRFRTNY